MIPRLRPPEKSYFRLRKKGKKVIFRLRKVPKNSAGQVDSENFD